MLNYTPKLRPFLLSFDNIMTTAKNYIKRLSEMEQTKF